MVQVQRLLCFQDTWEQVPAGWDPGLVTSQEWESVLHRSQDSLRSSFSFASCRDERDREGRFGSVLRREENRRMRNDLLGGHGTRRFLGSVPVDNDGRFVDLRTIRRQWNRGKEIIDICVSHNLTIPLLYRIVKKFGGFEPRSFSGGDGTSRRMDEIPEEELLEIIRERSAAIRKTWTPAIARSRRAKHSFFSDDLT